MKCLGCGRPLKDVAQLAYGTRMRAYPECFSRIRLCGAHGPEHPIGGPTVCTRLASHFGVHSGYGFAMRSIEWGEAA
ncbi:hypothetical protein [Nocardia xishanensis]